MMLGLTPFHFCTILASADSGMFTISPVFVKSGAEVKQGVVLAVLQAMKMEVEIKSPRNGKIIAVNL